MPSNRYARMTKAELLAELTRLGAAAPREELDRTACERDTYAAELEIQNRELREAQLLLENSRDLFADLFDFAPIAYAKLGKSGVILELNLTGAQMLGRERARCVGVPLIVFVARAHIGKVLQHVQRAARGDEALSRTECDLVANDGSLLPVELVSRVAEEGGAAILRTALLDLRDRKRADAERDRRLQEQLQRQHAEHANAVKDTFLAMLSHELRTPLAAIQNWMHVLRLKSKDPELLARGLQVIENSVVAQQRLVEDLLDVSRIARGTLQMERQRVDLAAVVAKTVANLRAAAQRRGVALELSVPADAEVELVGDEARLQQVVANLVANAIKFTPAGGRIDVEVRSAAGGGDGAPATIRVRDTGEGIEPAFLPHVFERFRQADPSTRRTHAGLGLGLSIAQHLVEAHGGRIRAESDGAGKGATFVVELPARMRPPATLEPPRAPEAPATLRGVHVVTVDDDPTGRESVAMCLEGSGASVAAVGCVADALAAIESLHPDVLVSDIAMPGADGFDLIARLRQLPDDRGGRTPAIALTAFAGAADRDRALRAGFDAWLPKPCPPAELATQIWRLARSKGTPLRAHESGA